MRSPQNVGVALAVLALVGCRSEGPFNKERKQNECLLLVKASGDVEIGDSIAKMDHLEGLLRRRVEELSDGKTPIHEITVRVSGEPNSSIGDLMGALEICKGLGSKHLIMHFDKEDYPVPLGRDPRPGLDENFMPPLEVRLEADDAGDLSGVEVRDLSGDTVYPDVTGLRYHAIAYLGDERGPGSIAEDAQAYLNCEKHLKVRYLQQALWAVSYYIDSTTGDRVEMFANDKISLFPFGYKPKGFDMEEFPSLDIQTFEIPNPESNGKSPKPK